ncbi:MAG: hypothetical protein EU536_04500 [Promethearchaeota archaeon]|nr:MAG: hypothetical protein EU536_04500 [Candidatus Lokiarchaeota archaeon]
MSVKSALEMNYYATMNFTKLSNCTVTPLDTVEPLKQFADGKIVNIITIANATGFQVDTFINISAPHIFMSYEIIRVEVIVVAGINVSMEICQMQVYNHSAKSYDKFTMIDTSLQIKTIAILSNITDYIGPMGNVSIRFYASNSVPVPANLTIDGLVAQVQYREVVVEGGTYDWLFYNLLTLTITNVILIAINVRYFLLFRQKRKALAERKKKKAEKIRAIIKDAVWFWGHGAQVMKNFDRLVDKGTTTITLEALTRTWTQHYKNTFRKNFKLTEEEASIRAEAQKKKEILELYDLLKDKIDLKVVPITFGKHAGTESYQFEIWDEEQAINGSDEI